MLTNKSAITLPIFLEFVEIKTKLASLMPLLGGFLWTLSKYGQLNLLNSLILFIAVILFDMTTTAINNTMDYYKAKDDQYKYQENVIGKCGLHFKDMVKITLLLLGLAFIFSMVLVFLTDPILLAIGALFYLIGITYTFGPLPTSRTPLGEVLSGTTMGFGIFYLAVFVSRFDKLLSTKWSMTTIQGMIHWPDTLLIFFMSLPFICLIANIMLANNTCDLETDRKNERYTLVHYIGKDNAVRLYQVLSMVPWFYWLLYIILGELPIWSIICFIAIYPHYKSVQRFSHKQVKSETFIESLKSFVLFALIYNGTLFLSIFFK